MAANPTIETSPLRIGLAARTLPDRLLAAKHALKHEPTDRDARLLMVQCLPDGQAKLDLLLKEAAKAQDTLAGLEAAQATGPAAYEERHQTLRVLRAVESAIWSIRGMQKYCGQAHVLEGCGPFLALNDTFTAANYLLTYKTETAW